MYVILNLKHDADISNVVQLLFRNGYKTVNVSERLEDVCPSCDKPSLSSMLPGVIRTISSRSTFNSNLAQLRTKKQGSPMKHTEPDIPSTTTHQGISSSLLPIFRSTAAASSEKNINKRAFKFVRAPIAPTISSSSVGSSERDPTSAVREIDSVRPLNVKSDPDHGNDDGCHDDVDEDIMHDDLETENGRLLNLQEALEVVRQQPEGSNKAHNIDVLAADVGVRKRRKTSEDADTVRCQFCMKCISRTGKISNQLAHLTRHAKLHASKKQYSCGLCGAQYSRRYLTAAHMKEMHQEEGEVMNHAVEMKEEYTALLEACFPGALAARHGMHSEGYEFDETALFEREDE